MREVSAVLLRSVPSDTDGSRFSANTRREEMGRCAGGARHVLRQKYEVLDDDGSPQKEAVPTPYRSEGSNPGSWRLIMPPGRPSQRLVTCHGREKG